MRIATNLLPKPEAPPERREVGSVLGVVSASSRHGSTTYKRMRLCPRDHALYTLGLRSQVEHEPLTLGFLFHHGLETFFKAVQVHQAVTSQADLQNFCFGNVAEAEAATWDELRCICAEPGYEDTYKRLEKLLVAYFEQWRYQDHWRIIAVEETLEYVDDGFEYTARLDLIVEEMLGNARAKGVWIVEHKTAAVVTADLLLNYAMDLQILGQKWLYKTCVDQTSMPPFRGVLVDIITTRHKVPKMERVEVNPSHYHTHAFEDAQRRWTRIGHVFEAEGWPKALGNCAGAARFFKACPYYTLCEGKPEHDIADWKRELEVIGAPHGYVDIFVED